MLKLYLLALLAIASLALPNQRPIIGIYTQSDSDDEPKLDDGATFQTYIAASYIKFIEMSGAQVVPIFAYSNQSDIAALLPKLNGVLFPGGDEPIDFTQRWTLNAKFILEWAMKQNDAGNVFPIWAVCLGFETVAVITSGSVDNMTTLSRVRGEINIINPMKLVNPVDKGYILGDLSDKLIQRLTTGQGVMFYDHNWMVSMDTYNSNKNLSTFWKVITETTSPYNESFVALWEARQYPFYGVQFHPQNNSFEWKLYAERSFEAVQIEQIMSNKFIQKARQSKNRFVSDEEYQDLSIYNYHPTSTSMSFTNIYKFNEAVYAQKMKRVHLSRE